jgi:hypothetical protein
MDPNVSVSPPIPTASITSLEPRSFSSSQVSYSLQLKGEVPSLSPTPTHTLDIVFRYSPQEDILSIYFKKLGDSSIEYTKPATRDGTFLLDYAEGLIVKAEFLWISERAKCHFFSFPSNLDALPPFVLNTHLSDSVARIFFVMVEQPLNPVPTKVRGVEELFVGGTLVGFQVELSAVFRSTI